MSATRWLPPVWALVLSVLLLGPALGHGYVLTYDMVWVPDLALRSHFLGVGSGLPRAVPSDAVVAVVDEVVSGQLLQKLVLLGALVGGGIAAQRLAPAGSLVGRLAAVSLYLWNPFVVERLAIGHWPVLLGYAVLPWVVGAGRRIRAGGRLPAALWWLLPIGSLSAGAGLVTATVLLAFALTRHRLRSNALTVGAVLAVNAPWIVSGLLHAGVAASDEAGARLFALNDAGPLPAPLAALGLGGIWNVEVLLPSREGVLGIVWLVTLLALVALGVRRWSSSLPRRDVVAFAACWLLGWGTAVLTWAVPDAVGWLVTQVPGSGLLRDGSRLLALCAPALVAAAAHGAAVLSDRLGSAPARVGVAVSVTLLPVAVLPDAGYGLSGRLRAVTFPESYVAARSVVTELYAAGQQGDLLVLPLSSYRAPAWNDGRKVLDPLGRYLPANYVASDELVVSGTTIEGEDPRVVAVEEALNESDAAARSRAVADLGIGVVVVDEEAPGGAPEVAGEQVGGGSSVRVTMLEDVAARRAPDTWIAAMAVAWALFVGVLLTGVVTCVIGFGRRVRLLR